jgi:hypothetical protein
MNFSLDTMVPNLISTAIGVIFGGVITWAVAYAYFRKQDEQTEAMFKRQEQRAGQLFTALARFLENFAANRGATNIGFTRDAAGLITNANVTVTPGAAEAGWDGYSPTVTTAPQAETRNRTESASKNIS